MSLRLDLGWGVSGISDHLFVCNYYCIPDNIVHDLFDSVGVRVPSVSFDMVLSSLLSYLTSTSLF